VVKRTNTSKAVKKLGGANSRSIAVPQLLIREVQEE